MAFIRRTGIVPFLTVGVIMIALLLGMTLSAFAATKYEDVNGVTKATLDNGLRVLVKENPANNVVAMSLYLACGSAYDPADKVGISYLMQDLITKGTTTRSSYQIALDTESVGASVGASAVWDAGGVYCISTASGLDKASDVFFDMIKNPSFPEAELEAAKARTLNTLKALTDEPSQAAQLGFLENFFGGHNYGRPVLGTPEAISKITRDDLLQWKARVYDPKKMVLTVVGRVKAADMVALAEKNLGSMKEPADKVLEIPDFTPATVAAESKLTKETPVAWIFMGYPAPIITDTDKPGMDVLNNILGGGVSGRLFSELRDKRGLAYTAFSAYLATEKGGTILGAMATAPQTYEPAKQGMLAEFARLKSETVTDEELEGAKNVALGQILMSKEQNVSIANSIAINELYAPGRDLEAEYLAVVKAVTPETIKSLAQKYLTVPIIFSVVPTAVAGQ